VCETGLKDMFDVGYSLSLWLGEVLLQMLLAKILLLLVQQSSQEIENVAPDSLKSSVLLNS
jgi:hypothetical protein